MRYSNAVRELWRHHDLGGAQTNWQALVRYATLAASSHNTQPWRFELDARRIIVHPDLTRRCPIVDPDNHHLYASLGCAAENLWWAAQAAGLRGHISVAAPDSRVQVDFEDAPPLRSPLFEAIPRRQCSRATYDGKRLTGEQVRQLEQAGRGEGVSVVWLSDAKQKDQVADYVAAGNDAQFADRRWGEELRHWIRFNGREAVRTSDGLYGGAMGFPDVPRWVGQLVMRIMVSAKHQNDKDRMHIRSSGAVAVFVSETNDAHHWVEAGRCYQRFALQATALDLRTAFINQPVEVATIRSQFASFLGIGDRRPDLIVRVGRGPEMPRSLRRQVAQVMVADTGVGPT